MREQNHVRQVPERTVLRERLAKFEQKPHVYEDAIRDTLQEARADKDQEVVDRATELVKQAEAAQPGITCGLVVAVRRNLPG